jgi:hypothetical protein
VKSEVVHCKQSEAGAHAGLALMLTATFVLVVTAVGCGGGATGSDKPASEHPAVAWLLPSKPIPGLNQRVVGGSHRGAVLLWAAGERPPRDVVIFLHGWGPLTPYPYGPWLRHFANRGNTVVFPVYQGPRTEPEALRANALSSIAIGLRASDANPRTVVAIGFTTGGIMAFDYAALAQESGLPAPRAIFAVYPGRNPPGGEIPLADLSQIPPETWLEVVTGPGSRIPDGVAQARALLRASDKVPPARRGHYRAPSPSQSRPDSASSESQTLWGPADRLIEKARADKDPSKG